MREKQGGEAGERGKKEGAGVARKRPKGGGGAREVRGRPE